MKDIEKHIEKLRTVGITTIAGAYSKTDCSQYVKKLQKLAGTKSRCGAFNLYGPWFMKPYYNFPAMLKEKFGKSTTRDMRDLLPLQFSTAEG